MMIGLACLGGVVLDRWLGEPPRWHPLVGFGCLAGRVEAMLRRGRFDRLAGGFALALLVMPPAVAVHGAGLALGQAAVIVDALFLYLALGGKSLGAHGLAVAEALSAGALEEARRRVGWMVSRETGALDPEAVARAATESVLENGNDAVFGALFWFALLGAPGVVLYRLVNTLDAMWGYKTERYLAFGWAAARLDDLLNWVPARLTAITYGLLGRGGAAWRCWRTQGGLTESPNGGVVMATGAGALGLRLGGAALYHGQLKARPTLGEGRPPEAADIARAVRLVHRGMWLWVAVILLGGWIA